MNWLTEWLRRLGTCGNAGVIVGAVVGGLLTLLDFLDGPLSPTAAELLRLWLLLSIFGWLVLLFVLAGLVRLALGGVALPALINALLVTGLTIWICRILGAWGWAFLIGIAVGILVGALLCGLYRTMLERR
jgi:hypothetical protein